MAEITSSRLLVYPLRDRTIQENLTPYKAEVRGGVVASLALKERHNPLNVQTGEASATWVFVMWLAWRMAVALHEKTRCLCIDLCQ